MQGPETSKTFIAKTMMNAVLNKTGSRSHNLQLAYCSTPSGIAKFMLSRMHLRQGAFGPLPNQSLIFFMNNWASIKPEIYDP
jgi:hypothetical protein